MSLFSDDIALSLVDDAFIFDTERRSAPLVIPAYVARLTTCGKVLAYGQTALDMVGRESNSIKVDRLLSEGGPAEKEGSTELFRFGLSQVARTGRLINPRVLVAARSCESIQWPIKDMVLKGGAREVHLMEHGMASAIGMGLAVETPEIKAVLSVSEDWFEFCVLALAGKLASVTGSCGLQTLIEDARSHLRLAKSFVPQSEALRSVLLARGITPGIPLSLPGWETWLGRTEVGRLGAQEMTSDALAIGIMPSLIRMTERIKSSLEKLSRDQLYQLSKVGIHACGVGTHVPGLAEAVAKQIGFTVTCFRAEFHPSITGARTVLKEFGTLSRAARKAIR